MVEAERRRGMDAKEKRNGREEERMRAYIKLKFLTFRDRSTMTVFEIFTIFTRLSPLYKQKRLLNDHSRYCVVKRTFFSSDIH